MSYNWLLVRGASADPLSLRFAALQNKQSIAENEIFKPERANPKILSKYTEDQVLVQDPLSFSQLRYGQNIHYQGPFEPDGVNLKCWHRFNHIAKKMHDHSFSGNYTYPIGNPQLCVGPTDGVKGGTIVTKINSNPNSIDYFYTPDAPGIRVSGMTTGFSVYTNFMINSIASSGGVDSTIHFKVDNSGGTDGWMLKVGPAGDLVWAVRRASTTRYFISSANKITTDRFIAVCLTYTASTNAMTMRIDNEVQTNTGSISIGFPTAHRLDLFHGIRTNQNSGKMIGRLSDFRWYNDMIFTSAQMDNIWNNKRSISPIQYGHLSVAGFAKFNANVYTAAYDATAFDSTGFATV
jgi:hypothetical protein